MKRSLVLVFLIIANYSLFAQTYDKKWALNIDYGSIEYRGELGDQFLDFANWQGGYGIQVARYLTPSFDAGFRGGYNYLSVIGPDTNTFSMQGELFTFLFNVDYKFANGATISENSLLKPYIKASGGLIFGQTSGSSMDNNGAPYSVVLSDWVYSLKGGTKVRITNNIDAFFELGNLWVTTVGMDGSKMDASRDQFLQLNLGVSFALGALKDKDRDGVGDKNDLCPGTPPNIAVDDVGCPFDTDGDGLYDYEDECPNEAGGESTKGCPDSDNDGLADLHDKCPDESGPKSNGGCPYISIETSEKVDVPVDLPKDEKDVRVFYVYQNGESKPVVYSSPNNKGLAYDTDKDGISDNIDLCPNEPGTVENYGCPAGQVHGQGNSEVINLPMSDISVEHGCPDDRDCDGVADALDACPENPGALRNKGCPIEKLKPKWRMDIEIQPVHFMSGRNFLTDFSKERVDALIAKLNQYPTMNVWMFGHTDPSGPSAANLILSEKRIETIVNYMVAKGVSRERIYTMGLGESFPVTYIPNDEAQLLNRRVEFYLFEFK